MENKYILHRALVKYETVLVAIAWVLFISIGLLQMFRVRAGFITNYGADIICTGLLYYLTRTNKTLLKRIWRKTPTEIQTSALLITACFVWEFLQKLDMSGTVFVITHGTFDPLDLLAYAVTVLVCYYIDVNRTRETEKGKIDL